MDENGDFPPVCTSTHDSLTSSRFLFDFPQYIVVILLLSVLTLGRLSMKQYVDRYVVIIMIINSRVNPSSCLTTYLKYLKPSIPVPTNDFSDSIVP